MPSEKPNHKMGENRRSNKPIMEKRRRARINSCLNDLKALILEALKKDPARHSKLEKADILEMTVRHLQNLQRQQLAFAVAADPNVSNKFRAGFNECATEVTHYLGRVEGLDPSIRQRLVTHLSNCISGINLVTSSTSDSIVNQTVPSTTAVNMHATSVHPQQQQVLDTGVMNAGFQLVPTRLPNGDIALLLPGNYTLATGNAASGVSLVTANRIPTVGNPLSIATMPTTNTTIAAAAAVGCAPSSSTIRKTSQASVGCVTTDVYQQQQKSSGTIKTTPQFRQKNSSKVAPSKNMLVSSHHHRHQSQLESSGRNYLDFENNVDTNDSVSSSSQDTSEKDILLNNKEPWRPW